MDRIKGSVLEGRGVFFGRLGILDAQYSLGLTGRALESRVG